MADISERIARLIRPEIRELSAYHVADAGGLIKLDAMENPFPWPGVLVEEWLEMLRGAELNRYPDGAARRAVTALREFVDVPRDMAVLPGNGSDELIQILQLALFGPARKLLAPVPSFVMYELIARYTGLGYIGVPLTDEFELDLPAMLEAIEREQPVLVFLASPNNPTGNLFDAGAVEQVIRAAPGLVVVDEAYQPFSGASFLDRLGEFDNLLVMRTLSKLGLAGLRFGALIGHPAWIAELDKLRLPYNINTLTQLSVEFALAHRDAIDRQLDLLRTERERLYRGLLELDGVRAWASRTNFILFRVTDARRVHRALRDAGVLVKDLGQAAGPLAQCLRVTVGTPAENDAFLTALKRLL